jgi:tetratricopeptide (TPR) repeat protein
VNEGLRVRIRAVCIAVVLVCGLLAGDHFLQRSAWNKHRLYQQLLWGTAREQMRAASALAQFGGQRELLEALKGGPPDARSLAQKALEYLWFHAAGPEALRLTQAAYDAADHRDFEKALALLDHVVKQFPDFAEGWNQRASVHWQMGAYQKSIDDSNQAIVLNPNHYGAWQGLGVCWLKLGDLTEALRSLRQAVKIVPHDAATRDALEKCEKLQRKPAPKTESSSLELI